MNHIPKICAALALLTASWFSILLARADASFRQNTPESLARAIALVSNNTDYLSTQALQLEYAAQDPTPLLENIAALTPLASAPRLRLGLAAEVRGDFDSAERWLLEASKVDHQFEPRWTLANYYFCRENANEFWKWMRAALEVSYGDRRPAFDLCWRMSADPQETLAKAIPANHDVRAAYLVYLLEEHRLAASVPVALELASDPNNRQLLLSLTDALLEAKDGTSAQALWRAMGYPPPSGIMNSDFQRGVGHGFDWRIFDVPGVNHIPVESSPSHRIEMSGREPESCELLLQMVMLEPHARYILHWESRTRDVTDPTGLQWHIAKEQAQVHPSEYWRQQELPFTADSNLAALAFVYQRPSGQPRVQGSVELRHVIIEAVLRP